MQQFPRSCYVPHADGFRSLSSSFDAAASSDSGFAPKVVGIEPDRFAPAFLGDFYSQVLNPDGVSVAFRHLPGIGATTSAYLPDHVHPQSGALAGVCDYSGRTLCLPWRALL